MAATGSIPVWTSNRGTAMMVRVALAQTGRTPTFVTSFDELRRAAGEPDVSCVIVSQDDLTQASVTARSIADMLRGGQRCVFLVPGHAVPDVHGPSIQIVKVPFSAAELRQAIESGDRSSGTPESPATHSPADITGIVRAEIDRIVREKGEAMLAEAVMKIVPELAEVMIRDELKRLLDEEGERAVSEDPPSEPD